MDRRFAVTSLAVLLVTAGGILLANRMEQPPDIVPLGEIVSGVEQSAAETESQNPSEQEWSYLIKEYEGRLAVFTPGQLEKPEIVYDTLVKYLPDYDRSQLEEGIPVKDYNELVSRVEDYIS